MRNMSEILLFGVYKTSNVLITHDVSIITLSKYSHIFLPQLQATYLKLINVPEVLNIHVNETN